MLWIVYVLCLYSVSGFTPSKRCQTDDADDYPDCGVNEVMTYNTQVCPPRTCDSLYATYSCLDGPPEPGCDCMDGFLRNATGVCIPKEDCPKNSDLPKCGLNEIATFDKIVCPPQSCESIYTLYNCRERPPEPGCDCVENYLRNASGVCIPSDECPPPPILPNCGINEIPTTDMIICPPQTCESVYTMYTCELRPPEPGCNCIENHLRNASGICIPSHECPPRVPVQPKCGPNEEASDKRMTCPPQTCESKYQTYSCLYSAPEPGCNCIDGYLRNSSGICIPSEECPAPVYNITCGLFEIKKEVKTQCPPQTCESLYSINYCEPGLPEPGCDCIDGYLRDEDDVCIPSEDCPVPPDYGDDDFDDDDDDTDTDTESETDDTQITKSRSKSETEKKNAINSSTDKFQRQNSMYNSESSSFSKSKSFSKSSSSSFRKNTSSMDTYYEYNY